MKRIAVLITVFNRKDKTLLCLENLYSQEIHDDYEFDVYVTNDGCTDGTPEAIMEEFPQVHIINASGNLFWNRGMYTAWKEAGKYDYDFYLWLNDDSFLMAGAICNMLKVSSKHDDNAIIVAAFKSKIKECVTYGGYGVNGKLLVPNGHLQKCVNMHGNCVLIPKSVYDVCGNLDWRFHHAIGDHDYCYRARKAGINVFLSEKFLGYCESNPQLPKWTRPEVPFIERWKNLYSPLGYAEPVPFFYYEMKNFGLFTALKHFISIHIRVIFPWLWKQNTEK